MERGAALRLLLVARNEGDRRAVHAAVGPSDLLADVGSLAEARALRRHAAWDCVLVDLAEGGAPETVRRAREALPDLPLVALTNGESDAVRPDLVRRGAEDVLFRSELTQASVFRAVRSAVERYHLLAALRGLEAELQLARRQAELGQLAGGVARELRSLLMVMLGSADALAASMEPKDLRQRDVAAILDAGERAGRLARQLVALSVRRDPVPPPLHLPSALRDLRPLLLRALGESGELCLRVEEETWPVRIEPGRLDQILLNLVVSARDAMASGGSLLLELRNRPEIEPGAELPPGDYVRLDVADGGGGTSRALRGRLFEPSFGTKDEEGTGSGLPTCRRIVEQAGGRIAIESRPGRGTRIRVLLPRARASD